MATYKDGLKNLLSSDRFTSRATPFRLAMMDKIRDRARQDAPVLVPNRFRHRRVRTDWVEAEPGPECLRLGRQYYESWRFQFFHRGGSVRPKTMRPGRSGWPEPMSHRGRGGVARYRGGLDKRKIIKK